MTEQNRQLFVLSDEVWSSIDYNEIYSTYKDMKEMGLDKPPCEKFAVCINANFIRKLADFAGTNLTGDLLGVEWEKTFCNLVVHFNCKKDGIDGFSAQMFLVKNNEYFDFNVALEFMKRTGRFDLYIANSDWAKFLMGGVVMVLIVTLATRNAIKEPKISGAMKRLIGKKTLKQNYGYVTTISVGKIYETEASPNTGTPLYKRRTHLRRGHIRNQTYGPDRAFMKKIFIEPVFVNADENWVETRKAYKVKVAKDG
jgi:hypothetical protein